MNSIMKCSGLSIIILAAFLGWGQASAQSYLFTSGTTNISGVLIVGGTTSASSLVISNGAHVTDVNGVIGNNLSTNNTGMISGSGSYWNNTGDLYIGGNSTNGACTGNSLSIVNSGRVDSTTAYVGYGYNAQNNSLTVSGTGSVLNLSRNLILGDGWYKSGTSNWIGSASGQRVTIVNGGQINDAIGIINGINESVVVTGPGSVWNNSSILLVGQFGGSCSLIITNAGVVNSSYGMVGVDGGYGQTDNNNTVLVAGSNSAWNVTGNLTVGENWNYNSMIISNGGTVDNVTGYIGYTNGANNNAVLVTGTGSIWSNSGNLYVGYQGSSNRLTIANGGRVYNSGLGATIGLLAGANNNAVTVTGSNSVWNNSGFLDFGDSSSGNTLTIANGGRVDNNSWGVIGLNPGSSNNAVTVTGAGSVWNTHGLAVGLSGSGNTLTLANGGAVYNSGVGASIGSQAGANNNAVTVTGTGSVWTNSGDLFVGEHGSGNTLTIANGSVVSNDMGLIGGYANNNAVTVTGPNSVWNNSSDLAIGLTGSSNTLIIANGGKVINNNGTIGNFFANNNAVTVTGAGSVWSNSGALNVGYSSSGNTLTIANGGKVSDANGWIGYVNGANNNSVTVTGGSVWLNSDALYVGYDGSGNSLAVSAGGNVAFSQFYLGYNADAGNNTLSISDASTTFGSLANDLAVGYQGANNHLIVANGATVLDANGYVGYTNSANGNTAQINGVWLNSANLYIGNLGANNSMAIAGGTVSDSNGIIGNNGNNNTVLVSGGLWSNSGLLTVGNCGNSNQLTISGGMVTASNAVIGTTASLSNQITVAGGGLIASNGSTGSLDVRNGTLTLNSGTIAVDSLYVTNANGLVNFAGGMLSALLITNANGQAFVVGGGPTRATLLLGSGGTHQFAQGLTIGNNGVLAGTGHGITINGNYTQTSGGSLDLTLGGTGVGQYDLFNITGTASLAGTLELSSANGFTPTNGETLVLLQSSGARTGVFSNLVNQTILFAFATYLVPNEVSVTWTQISFLAVAQTPNQTAVGRTIDAAVRAGQLGITNVTTVLYGLQTNQYAAALNLLAPAELSSMSMISLAALEGFGGQFMARVSDLRAGSHGFEGRNMHFYPSDGAVGSHDTLPLVVEQAGEPSWVNAMLSPKLDNPWGVYMGGNVTYLGVNSDGATDGYHVFGGGLTVGLDRRLNEHLVLGGSVGYADDTASLSGDGHVDVSSGQGGLYAIWMDGGLHLEGLGIMGYNSYSTVRQGLGGDTSGHTGGTEWSGLLRGGYDWQTKHWNFGPQVVFQYSSVSISQFTEQGSAAPLSISAQTQNEMYSQLGAHISYYKVTDKAWEIIPNLSLAWRHDYQNGGIAVDSAFANGAGGLFTVHGPTLGTDSVVVGVGTSIQWSDTVSTYVNYSTDFGRTGYVMQNLNLGMCIGF
jgi:T5SS/PEP-CTERM-associated repeat protein